MVFFPLCGLSSRRPNPAGQLRTLYNLIWSKVIKKKEKSPSNLIYFKILGGGGVVLDFAL